MPRYKPKTQVEIEAMTDQRLFNAHWWRASLSHNDKQTWATMENEVEPTAETDIRLTTSPSIRQDRTLRWFKASATSG